MSNRGIPTISLFSGAGGLDIGFLKAGFDIKACVEIDESYCKTLRANLKGHGGYKPGTVIHCQDINEFDASPYRNMGIRCVIGGPPCQTFSAAGRRSGGVIGLEDVRGQLFKAYCRVLDELKPETFVFENVYGLPGANDGAPWRAITGAFEDRGYNLRFEVVDAADYGVPQHRERLILIGTRSGEFFFPMPTHGPDSASGAPLVSVEDAIRDLQVPGELIRNDLGGLYGHLLSRVPEGLNYAFFTAEMGHPEPVFAWRSKFHDLLYKVKRSEPCRTIKAQPGKFTGPFHWNNRHFTIDELKRLQTFPDDYKLLGSYGKVLQQIGNSVPPQLAFVIASSVREQLFDCRGVLAFALRPAGFSSTFRQRQRLKSKQFGKIAQEAIALEYGGKLRQGLMASKAVETYFLNPKTLFDRRQPKANSRMNERYPQIAVNVQQNGSHLEIDIKRTDTVLLGETSVIELSGLRKYLPDYDSLRLNGVISEVSDIFHAWGVIEDALVKRSRFFTLIDIYGHYANRGDTVQMRGNWKLPRRSKLVSIINYFSNTINCGAFIQIERLCASAGLTESELSEVIDGMRGVRFDIRTAKTHPIIQGGKVLCTYPFPLLSPRALVESRVRLVDQSSWQNDSSYGELQYGRVAQAR